MSFEPKNRADRYTPEFFEGFAEDSARSSRVVLGHLFERYQPASVLDVGCGVGAWLDTAQKLGARAVRGLDGPWVKPEQLRIGAENFERIDFEAKDWPEIRPVDLAMSLEVAEHLTPEAGARLVTYLTESAPVVLFSAAIPGQGGEGHVNEQWQSYWAGRFAERGFRPSLALRWAVWTDNDVEFWYQQNLTLFVADSHAHLIEEAAGPMDVIHPRLYDIRVLKRARRRARWRRFLPFLGK